MCELALCVQMVNDHAGFCVDAAVEGVRVCFTGLLRYFKEVEFFLGH